MEQKNRTKDLEHMDCIHLKDLDNKKGIKIMKNMEQKMMKQYHYFDFFYH